LAENRGAEEDEDDQARKGMARPAEDLPEETGATELNTPATAKDPKPAAAPRTKTPRTSDGTFSR
jgi:hypothetical protein